MVEYRLEYENLVFGAYINNESSKYVIYCSGLPQYPSSYHPFISDLYKLGFNVITPRYIGSWENEGKFTLNGSIKTIEYAIKMIRDTKAYDTYGDKDISLTKSTEINLLGFSFGALPALANQKEANKVILLMPFLDYVDGDYSSKELKETLGFIRRGYKNTYNLEEIDGFLSEYKEVWSNFKPTGENLLIVTGEKDKTISSKQTGVVDSLSKAKSIRVNKGHSVNIGLDDYEKILNR